MQARCSSCSRTAITQALTLIERLKLSDQGEGEQLYINVADEVDVGDGFVL